MPKRVLICGSRDFFNKKLIEDNIKGFPPDTVIIQGGARGADTLAKQIAEQHGFSCIEFAADWAKYGKAAGPIRNGQMLKEGKPDIVYAFYTDYEGSKGTRNMVDQAIRAGITVYEYDSAGKLIGMSNLPKHCYPNEAI